MALKAIQLNRNIDMARGTKVFGIRVLNHLCYRWRRHMAVNTAIQAMLWRPDAFMHGTIALMQ